MKTIIAIALFTCACFDTRAQVNIITTIAGTDTPGFCCEGIPATVAKLHNPEQLCLDNFGNLFIADASNNRVRKIVLSTGVITTIAGTGTGGYNGDNISATSAQLWIPDGVCCDTLGNIYIADALNHRIRKVTASTGIITTVAGIGTAGLSGDGGAATSAQMRTPDGMFIDKLGNLFFTDIDNNVIRKVTAGGIISRFAGTGGMGYSGDGGPALDAQLNTPADVCIDSLGNLIFSDGYNNAIRKVDVISGVISTIAGNGTAGYAGNGGLAINAKLNNPYGIFIDKDNNVYFSDGFNGVVRKIQASTGIISAVAGCGTLGFGGDGGPATDAKLYCSDIFMDSYGTMYVADIVNNRIRKVYNPQLGTASPDLFKGEVFVYPNPARDEVIVEYAFPNHEDAMLQISDITGRAIITEILSSTKQKEVVDIRSLSSGLYIYKVVQGNILISTGKMVKE